MIEQTEIDLHCRSRKLLPAMGMLLLLAAPTLANASYRERCIFEGTVKTISAAISNEEGGADLRSFTLNVKRATPLKGPFFPGECAKKVGKPLDVRLARGKLPTSVVAGDRVRLFYDLVERECVVGNQPNLCRAQQFEYIPSGKLDSEYDAYNPPFPKNN